MGEKQKRVSFYLNGTLFHHLDELSKENQEKLTMSWRNWEKTVWSSAYQHFLQINLPNRCLEIEIIQKSSRKFPLK